MLNGSRNRAVLGVAIAPGNRSISTPANALVSEQVRVRGQVQGVGFRPFVYRLAIELGIAGWVRNDADGVEIAAQGPADRIQTFRQRLWQEAPLLARIEQIEVSHARPAAGITGFVIADSRDGIATTGVTPDAALCDACLEDLFAPDDRRYRYPFTNCTHCGPRYTITRALPYDRPQTTMARFTMCPLCDTEYRNPNDRRFHAQPNACPDCGPRISLRDASGYRYTDEDPIAAVVRRLQQGAIVAMKGIGGFHLLCNARNPRAVERLRSRKQREAKPLAILAANLESIAAFAEFDDGDIALLQSIARPIVLLRKQPQCDEMLKGIAPGMGSIGVMFPYQPLQYLLFHEAAGRPSGTAWLHDAQSLLLVCTSANPHGEPLVIDDEEALQRLQGVADAFLLHDRPILARCDDSVVQRSVSDPATAPREQLVRLGRGYAPRAIRLARSGPAVLAFGGSLKNSVCVTRHDEALLSTHIGDLDNAESCRALDESVAHLLRIFAVTPGAVAHDLHPDFYSSRRAAAYAAELGLPCIPVQHHHAHIGAVLAEHGIQRPVIGLALDGIGLGVDGGAWGGELLRVDGACFSRLGHLYPSALPGGDRAAREPWRLAVSALYALGRHGEITKRYGEPGAQLALLIERGVNAPLTSSAGRLFDAAAALLGVATHVAYEGEAAMRLEALARQYGPVLPWRAGWCLHGDGRLDLRSLLGRLAKEADPAAGAAIFHATLAEALAHWASQAAQHCGITDIVFGGGCFLNRVLSQLLAQRLTVTGLQFWQAERVPPNDGGLCLGQAWVAMHSVSGG